MNDIVKTALLYDFYGELLTEQQRKIYEEVYFNDCSKSEVAKDENISRQGVYDILKRTTKALEEYESKLGLVEKHLKIKKLASQIEKAANTLDKKSSDKIIKLSRDIQNL